MGVRLLGVSQKFALLKRGVVHMGEAERPWHDAEDVCEWCELWTPAGRPWDWDEDVCEVFTSSCSVLASMMSSGERLEYSGGDS